MLAFAGSSQGAFVMRAFHCANSAGQNFRVFTKFFLIFPILLNKAWKGPGTFEGLGKFFQTFQKVQGDNFRKCANLKCHRELLYSPSIAPASGEGLLTDLLPTIAVTSVFTSEPEEQSLQNTKPLGA